ncbi:AAA family ATPase [Solwaraspora sp. WMMD1047]|uniref:UvrD-helicase domain-containing protein n=1 Tax=Solwaraspora sp. WMMD1047 TaxID=3016102 RepID=UPI0024176BDA|nr:UvrD-helicase domain-containing protein [Solwaraspora sp. WMMD1047]MDG4829347.1 AAA family ATPase [Solwaraspora sp. WMMD1047]
MPQLAFANSFWQSYETLEKPVRAGVRKAMEKFQQLSIAELHADKGLHLEAVHYARDSRMRTIRINMSWRGVVLAPDDGGDTFLLLAVVPHDEAYGWAAKRLYTVNTATRALEVRDVDAIEQLTPALERAAAGASGLLFAGHSDQTLRRLGIDDQVLRAARTIVDKPQLEAFGGLLPEDQFEVLQYLAEGFTPEEVYRDVVADRRPADADARPTESLHRAITNTRNRITLVTGLDEVAEILAKPFDAWRVFLHPAQHRVAYHPAYPGPTQVSGGPGTGKTVVALHRVKHLLDRHPGARVLLTTYTTELAGTLREHLELLLDGDRERLARVEVTTVNALAVRVVRAATGRMPYLLGDAAERQLWRQVADRLALPQDERFLAQEYRQVILAQRIGDRTGYLRVARLGRGTALGPRQREQVWQAVEAFLAEVAGTGARTHLQLCDDAAGLLADADPAAGSGFDHVVVDEAQDLHPAQWRLLRAAVPPGPDDFFITGDPHQRIYDSHVSLDALGLPTTGRRIRLRINYRSTEEILAWATRLLPDTGVADLSGDGTDTLTGYRSLLRGRQPHAAGHPTEEAEFAALVQRINHWRDRGVPTSEIGVCTRFRTTLDRVYAALVAAGIPAVRVRDHPATGNSGVRLATMHAMKGLEFRCVAVVGVTAEAVPYAREITPVAVDRIQHDGDLLRERCALFVACTRAREELHVSWTGTPSPFLPPTPAPAAGPAQG